MCDMKFNHNSFPAREADPGESRDDFFAKLFGINPEILQIRNDYITEALKEAVQEAEAKRQAELAAKAGHTALQADVMLAETVAVPVSDEEANLAENGPSVAARPSNLATPGYI